MIDVELLPSKYLSFLARWDARTTRMSKILDAVNGDWGDLEGPDNDQIENRSPNFIQVALEDTAESASLIPTVRVAPSEVDKKDSATAMERMAISYMDVSQYELLTIRSMMDVVAYGLFTWIVYEDPETGSPTFQWRDPRTCFPEAGWKTMDSPREVFFARDLYINQLKDDWKDIVERHWPADEATVWNNHRFQDKKVVLLEYFTESEYMIAALYQTGINRAGGQITYTPIVLEQGENPGGVCPVVIGQRITLDDTPRGQFDQVIGLMKAHIRLMGMVLDYADQAVYSDVWVKDLIGPMNFGGGAYIQLGPNGQIGRVPPAVSDISVFREMDSLLDSMHLAGRYPKSRPGEISQAIASAKFLEASAGVMNTVIRTLHLIMKRALESALHIAFRLDALQEGPRMISGVLNNQQFIMERDPADIDLKAKVRVEYGLGLGHDPAQAMVLGIQASQSGLVSKEFVQENFDGITDVARENSRIDAEKLRDMAFAQLLEGLQSGGIPQKALVEIARARQQGDDIFELFDKYVVQPQEEMQANQLTSGLNGMAMQPGSGPLPPAPGGQPGPTPPPPEELMAGLMGGGGAPPPTGNSRLNVNMGGGSFASSNSQTGA